MKTLSLLLSLIVGICSIILLKERIANIAIDTAAYLFSSSSSNTTGETQQTTYIPSTNMSVPRAIRKVFLAIEQAEGAGARVRRSIGTPSLKNFSPFLMLDHFSIKPGAGFPDQYVPLCPTPTPKDLFANTDRQPVPTVARKP